MSSSASSSSSASAANEETQKLSKKDVKNDIPADLLLRRAAQKGDCDAIRKAHAMGVDLNSKDQGLEEASSDDKKDDKKEDDKKDDDKKDDDKKDDEDDKKKKLKEALDSQTLVTGNTALHFASQEGHVDAVVLLLQLGASVDSRNKLESTPLHRAISFGHENVVEKLLRFSADIKAKNKVENNALHIATYVHNWNIIKLLLHQPGAVQLLRVKNKVGMTPLDYCNPKTRSLIFEHIPEARPYLEENEKGDAAAQGPLRLRVPSVSGK